MAGITAIKRNGYLHGGVAHPDGRRGFFKGAQADASAGKGSMSPGTSGAGGSREGGYGRNQGNQGDQQGDLKSYDYNRSLDTGPNRFELAKQNAEDKLAEEQRIKALGTTGPLKTNYKTSYFQNLRNKSIQKALNRNKILAMKRMNLTTNLNPFSTQIPDWAKELTEKELVGIATTGPYLSQQNTKADVNKFAEGKDLLNRVTVAQSILDTDNFPQSEYERLFPSNLNVGGGGGRDNSTILPYPYNVQQPDEGGEEDTGPDYRFGTGQKEGLDVTLGRYFNQGGRVPRNMGGIMNAVPRQGYFLGGIGKAIKGVVGGVADAAGKVLKSDVGKMAIAGLGAYYLGGGKNLGGAKMFGNTGFGTSGFMSNLGRVGTFIKENPFKTIGLASVALPFLAGEPKPNEDIGMTDRGGRLLDSQGNEVLPSGIRKEINEAYESKDPERIKAIENYYAFLPPTEQYLPYPNYAVGGRVAAQEGGLMNLGGMEKDYRNEGGFVPIGKQEKADDVPARLSVNEFVFTADAVRNAGGGDIDKGAEVMENMMKNLENGGRVSEESQGNTGAQEMFSVSERIGEVI